MCSSTLSRPSDATEAVVSFSAHDKASFPFLIIKGRTRHPADLLNLSWRVQCGVKIPLAVAHVFIRRHPAIVAAAGSASILSERIAECNLEPIFGY